MTQPRQSQQTTPRHKEVLNWVDELIMDLYLIDCGKSPNTPINAERLKEWDTVRQQLTESRKSPPSRRAGHIEP